MIVAAMLTIIFGYLLGNLNGAILISRFLEHDDVRNHGSGNAGFTNFFRNYGTANALIVMAIDGAKAVLACMIGKMLLSGYGFPMEGLMLGAVSVGMGHDFPALLGFKGGKGIICGFLASITADWRVGAATFVVFALCYVLTQYVSLSSVLGAVTLAATFAFLHWQQPWAVVCCTIMCTLAIYMHRENIVRLLKGTERKTNFFKKEKKG